MGDEIDLIVLDAEAVVLSNPRRPKSVRVPLSAGARARSTIPPPITAAASLAAREKNLPPPRRRPPATASLEEANEAHDGDVEDDSQLLPQASPAPRAVGMLAGARPRALEGAGGRTPASPDRRPSAAASGGATSAAACGAARCSADAAGSKQVSSAITALISPPQWAAATSLEEKLILRAAIRHYFRDRVRHYMKNQSLADDVYYGEVDSPILFREAVQRTFDCAPQEAAWILTQRLPPKRRRRPSSAAAPTTSPLPPSTALDSSEGAGASPPSTAVTLAAKPRVRLQDFVRGMCYRVRSNLHHAIGRATARAWVAGTRFDEPIDEEEADENDEDLDIATTSERKAACWRRGRRYMMTVRGRKGLLQAFRVFKHTFRATSSATDDTETGDAAVDHQAADDGSVVHAWRAQLAWISAKVRVRHAMRQQLATPVLARVCDAPFPTWFSALQRLLTHCSCRYRVPWMLDVCFLPADCHATPLTQI